MTTEARTAEFHSAFGHPVRTEPTTIDRDEALLVLRLIEEEYLELADALFPGVEAHFKDVTIHGFLAEFPSRFPYKPDLIAVADAIGDIDVVNNGAGIRHGLDMQAISREVFASNMTKLGADGKPVYDATGKIQKGPDFREPDLAAVLGI